MLPPNLALFSDQMRELSAQLGNSDWFTKRGIEINVRDGYWILRKKDTSEKNHWNMLCNGLVFSQNGLLISCPPSKIHSYNDARVNLGKCDLVEKKGGEMICVCFPDKPLYHTSCDIVERDYNLNFKGYRFGYTFTFQYVDKLYLVAGRALGSLYEHEEFELDVIATSMGVDRPARFPYLTSWQQIVEVLRRSSTSYLVRDKTTGERAKVYLTTERYKNLLPAWLSGARDHEKHEDIDKEMTRVIGEVKKSAEHWHSLNLSSETLAEEIDKSIEPRWQKTIIKMLQNANKDRWENIIYGGLRKLRPRHLLEILGLHDGEMLDN